MPEKINNRLDFDVSQLGHIVEESLNEIFVFDSDSLKFKLVNKGARKNLGYSMSELRNMTPVDIKPLLTEEEFLNLVEPLKKGELEYLIFTTVHQRKNKTLYDVEIRLSLSFSKENSVYLAIIQDITERKKNEEDLLKVKEEAQNANKAKSNFLAMLSHEIRTPLNAIIGFADALALNIYSDNPKEHENVANIISTAGKGLNSLLGQILDFSAIEANKIELNYEVLNPKDIIKPNVEIFRSTAEKYGAKINFERKSKSCIKVDPTKLLQIVHNFVSNAAKFGGENCNIDLGYENIDNKYLRIFVKDTGPGIDKEEISNLFEAFERSETTRNIIQGTGLGLAISKTLTEKMGGAIGCESRLNHGSVFWVQFPISSEN